MDFLNAFSLKGRHTFSHKNVLFNTLLLERYSVAFLIHPVIPLCVTLNIITPKAYTGRFNSGNRIASPGNYTESSWFYCIRLIIRGTTSNQLVTQVALPIESILWTNFNSTTKFLSDYLGKNNEIAIDLGAVEKTSRIH